MTTTSTKPAVTDLAGLPFIDDSFTARRLLALTAAVRCAEAQRRGLAAMAAPADAAAWLVPALAFALSTSTTPVPALPLTPARRREVIEALAGVAELMPSWAPLLRLPVRYARLYRSAGRSRRLPGTGPSMCCWPRTHS